MKENRPKAELSTIDGSEKSRDASDFLEAIPDEPEDDEDDDDDEDEEDGNFSPSLYRLAHAKCGYFKMRCSGVTGGQGAS